MENLTINEHLIRFKGKVAIERNNINLGDEVKMEIKGECVKVEEINNFDGSKDIIAVIKLLEPILKDEE